MSKDTTTTTRRHRPGNREAHSFADERAAYRGGDASPGSPEILSARHAKKSRFFSLADRPALSGAMDALAPEEIMRAFASPLERPLGSGMPGRLA